MVEEPVPSVRNTMVAPKLAAPPLNRGAARRVDDDTQETEQNKMDACHERRTNFLTETSFFSPTELPN